jgi:UDP-MurNAc hydroxylase
MKITHLSNSFILFESLGVKICCDPWFAHANYGGWHSFPEFEKSHLISSLLDIDLVYISHLHDDHFDSKFLKESGLNTKIFLIKNFTHKTLYNKLKAIGVNQIYELDSFEIFLYKGLKMSILPQLSSNSSDLDEDVEYDLDTSFIISDGDMVFLNQVDNPYSISDFEDLYKWIVLNYGKITISALMAGAASEYPQAFLNINRNFEKDKIIISELERLANVLDVLKPKYYFAAGGTYFIPGKLHKLNQFIALPNPFQIKKMLEEKNITTVFLELEGGKSITLDSKNYIISEYLVPSSSDIDKSIDNHKNDLYDYESEVKDLSFDYVVDLFSKAKLNWEEELLKKNIKIEQNIDFVIYKNMHLSEDLTHLSEMPIGVLKLKSNLSKSKGDLKIHIDLECIYLCLIRKKVWNGTIGALCLFERTPNVFYPSVTFSLNYLIVNNFIKSNTH